MKIGIVSDTHNNLKSVRRIVELFNAAGVTRVIHTGDVTQARTLAAFADLTAPLWGVWGNNDVERDALSEVVRAEGFEFVEPPLQLRWAGRRLIIVHDPLEFEGHLNDTHDIALHGHTHRLRIERTHGRLVFNPGECAGHLAGLNAVGVLDLSSDDIQLLRF